ncbi:basic salivary proline-rich protein 1-like [Cinclus cinclus]|uniref:basic salivary proline-rich protein 1-like n=1 Tax=Cinclus cinclus TaxID=127875 RepID=UPI002E14C25A
MDISSMSPSHGNSPPKTAAVEVALPQGAVLQGQAAPAGGLPSPRAPTGSQPPLRHPPAPAQAPAGAVGGSVLPYGPPGAAGAQLPPHGLYRGLQGNPSSVPGAPPAPPARTLVSPSHMSSPCSSLAAIKTAH